MANGNNTASARKFWQWATFAFAGMLITGIGGFWTAIATAEVSPEDVRDEIRSHNIGIHPRAVPRGEFNMLQAQLGRVESKLDRLLERKP